MSSPVTKVTPVTKASAMTISISEIAKNVDVDGDGDIEPEEKEILDTLKSMDVDGDGTISLKELVNLGGKMNDARKNATFYKRLIYGVILLCIFAMAGVFVACIAAVETTKDSRPEADGTLKTTVVGGDAKVVATGLHKASIKLTDLNTASFSTLRGISDLGFKVGNRFYQYTITGFEQDYLTSGTATVRLFTSRGDSIYITSTAASLEKVSGNKIDIAAATLAGKRHLLQLDSSLMDQKDMDAAFGNVQTTSTETMEMTMEQITSMAGDGTTFDNETSNGNRAYNIDCPDGMMQEGTPEKPACKCPMGYTGAEATFDNIDTYMKIGTCAVFIPPEALNIQLSYYTDMPDMAYASCGMGYKGMPMWDFAAGNYTGKCVAGIIPAGKGLVPKPVVEVMTEGFFTSTIKEMYVGCARGFEADEQGPPTFDFNTGKWNGGCVVAACPVHSALDEQMMFCKCVPGYYGPGHMWNDTETGHWSYDDASFCYEKEIGLNYDCSGLVMTEWGGKDCPATAAPMPNNTEINNGWIAGDNFPVGIACKEGYAEKPLLSWSKKGGKWIGACLMKSCFPNSVKMTEDGEVRCECEDTYVLEGTGDWDFEAQKFDGKCVKIRCPANSANEMGNKDANEGFYVKVADDECFCKPGYTGTGYVWDSGTEMFLGMTPTPAQNTTGVKQGCQKMKCPVTMVDYTEPGGPLECGCPELGFHEKADPTDGNFGMSVRNDSWTFVGTCLKPACPAGTVQVAGEGTDKNSYCKCDTAKGNSGQVNWWYPAQKEFVEGNLTEAAARKKVENEHQKQQWYDSCSPIPCPPRTTRVNGKCVCGAGYIGQVSLDPMTKTYMEMCYEAPLGSTRSHMMSIYNPTTDDYPTATCDYHYKPVTKVPFQWNFAKQAYAAKDDINKTAYCVKVACPAGTHDTDLTFEDDNFGCICKQGGTAMIETSDGYSYTKYAGWNETTFAYKLTKAACM